MKAFLRYLAISAALLALVPVSLVHASSISGLYNTGVDSNGLVAPIDVSVTDTHYVIDPLWSTITGANPPPLFPTAWIGQGSSDVSRWIVPAVVPGAGPDVTYDFILKFNLTGYNPSSANFSGRWATDNSGSASLNGNLLGQSAAYDTWSSFSASTGFVAGVNTLKFSVVNAAFASPNPVGLRVEFTASNVTPVPEPESYAMLLAGLGLLGFIARRRKGQSPGA